MHYQAVNNYRGVLAVAYPQGSLLDEELYAHTVPFSFENIYLRTIAFAEVQG
jgi:hypothetical protein